MIAASKLEGTPYLYRGRNNLGVDCLGLVALAYENAIGSFEIEWPDYGPPWHRDPHHKVGLAFLERVFSRSRTDRYSSGNVIVFNMGKLRQWHVGICSGENGFWHCHFRRGVEHEKLSADWRQKVEAVFKISEEKNGNFGI